MNKYRVWCSEKNEWEKDEFFLTRLGTPMTIGKFGHMRPLMRDTHIVEFASDEIDVEGRPIYKGDIIEFSFGDCIVRKIVNYKHSSFWLDDYCENKSFIPFGVIRSTKSKTRIIGNIHQGLLIHEGEQCKRCGDNRYKGINAMECVCIKCGEVYEK